MNIRRRDGLEVAIAGDVTSTGEVTIDAFALTATLDRAETLELFVVASRAAVLQWTIETNAGGTAPLVNVEIRFE